MQYRNKIIILLGVLFVALCAWVLHNQLMPQAPTPQSTANAGLPTEQISIGSTTITVEVASTDAQREQGLSDRTSLAPDHGMLFVFQQDGDWGFWMKDMSFSIDMLFISATQDPTIGSVVSIDANASPSTYNAGDPQASKVFYPPLAVRYVLELPAGYAAEHGIAVGDKVVLQ